MSTSATREATNSESAAIWRVMVRVYDKQGRLQWRILGSQPPALIFRQSWGPRDQKNFLETGPPAYLGVWMTSFPTLKVWIRHWAMLRFILSHFLRRDTTQSRLKYVVFLSEYFLPSTNWSKFSTLHFCSEKKNHRSFQKEYICAFWPNEQNSLEIKGNHKC